MPIGIIVPPGKTYTPVTLRGVFTVEYDCVHRQVRGERINDLPSLYPFKAFRDLAFQGARKFVADLEKQGYQLRSNEADLRVWGPYLAKRWQRDTNGEFRATGRLEDEVLLPEAADFLIVGEFLATKMYTVEYRVTAPEEDRDG